MRIADVEVRAVAIPVAHPARISIRLLRDRHDVLVDVRDTDGALDPTKDARPRCAGTGGDEIGADVQRVAAQPSKT